MSETNKTPNSSTVKSNKLAKNENLGLIAVAAGCLYITVSAVVISSLVYKLGSVSATVDNILRTLESEDIIQNLKIGE